MMLDPYNRAYYIDSMTNTNRVAPSKTKKTLTSRRRKKTSNQDAHQHSTSLKTPPPSPSHPSEKSKRSEKRSKIAPLSANHHHHHHRHHHHHHHHRQHKGRRSSLISLPIQPHDARYKFNKELIDTFCFHWPAMHCYVLVRILPGSIAILPIRTRLAFLYFCHAPRPHHPTLHPRQRRIQSMFKPWRHTLAFNSDEDDDDDGPSEAVTLADVLKDHHRMDVGWIHAPCRLDPAADPSPLLTLRSRCTTLELKARCLSEKKQFIQLFYWNKRYHRRRHIKTPPITVNEILQGLERQNLDLQHSIDALTTQIKQDETEILQLEEQTTILEDQMDTLWTALDRTTDHQAELNDLKRLDVGMELRKHMDVFLETQQRVWQRLRGQGSFAWVIDHSFQRLHRFQARHAASDRQGSYLAPTLLVLLAFVLAYFYL